MSGWETVKIGRQDALSVLLHIGLKSMVGRVVGCKKSKRKICVHVIARYANCRGNHIDNSPHCTSRHKADIETRKEKKIKISSEKEKEKAGSEIEGED